MTESQIDRVRIWRLRKAHQQVDAYFHDRGAAGCELRFLHNGRIVYTRIWATRALAGADAATRRTELEREGWSSHW